MATTIAVREHRVEWSAMGTTCHVLVVGGQAEHAARAAQAQISHLESRWSRFLPDSDVSRMNRGAGRPVAVASETVAIVTDAIAWWHATGGLFDPTVLQALAAAGYDRSRTEGHGPITTGRPAPGCAEISVDPEAGTILLPPGVGIDLGGIGKGRAVDLVASSLDQLDGGLVDLGGDLRVWGAAPGHEPGWPIAIDDLRDGSTAAVLGLTEGAVATSSTLRRCWEDGDRSAHHLIDPRTGRPSDGELVSVTTVTGAASAAEVIAKAALISGSVATAARLVEHHGAAALLVPADGPPVAVGGFEELCWTPPVGQR